MRKKEEVPSPRELERRTTDKRLYRIVGSLVEGFSLEGEAEWTEEDRNLLSKFRIKM